MIKIEDPDDGDYTGMTVMFMVGMEDVEQSGEWMEGMVSPLNLMAMAMAMEPEPTMEPVIGATGPRGRERPDQETAREPTELPPALTAKQRSARPARPERLDRSRRS